MKTDGKTIRCKSCGRVNVIIAGEEEFVRDSYNILSLDNSLCTNCKREILKYNKLFMDNIMQSEYGSEISNHLRSLYIPRRR